MPANNNISYHWGDDNLLILLGNRVETRIRILFWAEFLLTTGFAAIVMLRAFPLSFSMGDLLSITGAMLLFMLATYRFFSRIFFKERLLLKRHTLDIITKTPFSYKCRTFNWAHMGPLHYVGQDKKTDHPLTGKCYDYFGFETQEKLIHKLHNEGNLYFNYGGFPIRFGKGIYSWKAEEVVNMMQLYIGNKLLLGPEWSQMVQEHELGDY